jgi:predicted glutamine amidotransferase
MCRMMGVVSQGPVYYDLFEEFADLASQGMCPLGAPDERGHKDGWGLLCFRNGGLAIQMKDVGSAEDASKYYGTAWKIAKLNLERAPDQSLIVLGHLRRASSKERVAQKWSHPFVAERDGVTWAFQHNGSLKKELPAEERIDSQILFDMLLEGLNGGAHEDVVRATKAARDRAIDEYEGFTSLNFMISDGRALHVYRDFQSNGQYYTLYLDNLGEMVIVTSEPILAMKAEPIPRGILHSVMPDLQVRRTELA